MAQENDSILNLSPKGMQKFPDYKDFPEIKK